MELSVFIYFLTPRKINKNRNMIIHCAQNEIQNHSPSDYSWNNLCFVFLAVKEYFVKMENT